MQDVGEFRAACFARVADGLIVSSTEYWIGVGTEQPAAAWREKYRA